jgi:flavin-dependent dehydrogenase
MKIAIVGAGPAGCHLAHCLTDTDHKILLFDHRVRPPHEVEAPRVEAHLGGYEKPCGGGLSSLVGRRFADVMALSFPRHRPPRVALRASDGSLVEKALNSSDWVIVSRAEFGWALLGRVLPGDRVRYVQQRVTGIETEREQWLLHTAAGDRFSADFLVGADGACSLVRREVVGLIPRQHLGLAVGYWVRGVPDAIIFQTYLDLEGYLWSFPRADHASVGIATRLDAVPPQDLFHRVDRFLAEVCPGIKKQRRWTASLPMAQDTSLWDTPCVGPDWALLGDAAGHVNPLTGEGIAYALWSAKLLAESFKQGKPEIYEDLWRQQYGNGLIATSAMLSAAGSGDGVYEILFQLAMAMALQSPGQAQ